jgi:hypothetical protein
MLPTALLTAYRMLLDTSDHDLSEEQMRVRNELAKLSDLLDEVAERDRDNRLSRRFPDVLRAPKLTGPGPAICPICGNSL